jgi:hypothetical protein
MSGVRRSISYTSYNKPSSITRVSGADIFRGHGAAWRQANAGHVSLGQLKVMSAIENCRTAALGGRRALREREVRLHADCL